MAIQQAEIAQERKQYVTFMLEGECYGIDVMKIQEILRETEIAPVPGAPCYVNGIINLRGNVVSVVSARNRFGLPDCKNTHLTRIIVVEIHQQILGIMVDSVSEVIDIDPSEIDVTPHVGDDETSAYIEGVICREETILTLINIDKLLVIPAVALSTVPKLSRFSAPINIK